MSEGSFSLVERLDQTNEAIDEGNSNQRAVAIRDLTNPRALLRRVSQMIGRRHSSQSTVVNVEMNCK